MNLFISQRVSIDFYKKVFVHLGKIIFSIALRCIIFVYNFHFPYFHISVAEDLSITRIAGLTWDQWNARLAMPLITQLREGSHPLLFPTDLSVSAIDKEPKSSTVTNPDPQSPQDNQPGYSCPDCGRMYKLKSSLRNHQKWECGKEPSFSVSICDNEFYIIILNFY